eukprot:835965-Prymnesium_polylepis.1
MRQARFWPVLSPCGSTSGWISEKGKQPVLGVGKGKAALSGSEAHCRDATNQILAAEPPQRNEAVAQGTSCSGGSSMPGNKTQERRTLGLRYECPNSDKS